MKIVFMGTPDFAVASLQAIVEAGHEVACVVTVPDRQTGRGLKLTPSPVKAYAKAHHLPLLQPEKLRQPEFVAQLQALQADLFVVVAFRMLPQCVWSIPPLGTFNLHASLLPQYRGAAPINWALINGEHTTGVTTFLLNERIDEGNLLLQESTPITAEDTAETLHDRLCAMGSRLVVQTIAGLAAGTLSPTPQPAVLNPKPAPKIFKEDCAISWQQSGEQIVNLIRGLCPYPAATMRVVDGNGKEQSIKVFRARFVAEEAATASASPAGIGSTLPSVAIFCAEKKQLKIALKFGKLEILELQMNGKRRISAEEFLRGYDVSNWKIIQ